MGMGVRILTAAALATVWLTGPAFAQAQQQKEKSQLDLQDEERMKRNADIDKEYNAMRKHTQEDAQKAAKIDPWQNMRAPLDNAKR
jgi:hypothetical protein